MKKFEAPQIEIKEFKTTQIITTSEWVEFPGDDNDVAWGE